MHVYEELLQPTDDTPLWVPVSLVSSAAAAVTPGGNTTAREQRWLEVFPPWEDRHRIAVGGDPACADLNCGRPLASPPLQVPPDNGVWLPKAREGPFLTSIPDEVSRRGAGAICPPVSLQM